MSILCLFRLHLPLTQGTVIGILCRARAIENTMYVLAPNQTGAGASGVKCFGHSLIVDYNGQILAEANSVDCSDHRSFKF